MGLFKCKLCGKVYSTESQSIRANLCRHCFLRLEDMYSASGIHDYIRDNGLAEDFDPVELAHELEMNPRIVELLFEMGFFDRDIQVYSYSSREKKRALAKEFSHEIDRLAKKNNEPEIKITPPIISYGGRLYRRQKRF